MKSKITCLLTLNWIVAAMAFAAEPSATPASQATSPPAVANGSSPEAETIARLDKDYEAAYNRGDAHGVAAFFTNDAEYVDEEGNVVSGRGDIEKLLGEEFSANPGAKLQIHTEGVRVLSPDVLVENGVATLSATDGSKGASRYVAIYVKRAGDWKISQLTQTAASNSASAVQDLAPMAGRGQDGAGDNEPITMAREGRQ